MTPSGEEIRPLDLRRSPYADPLNYDYIGPLVPPDQPFQVAVSGLDWDGTPYDITNRKVFQTKTVAFTKIQRSGFNYNQGKEFVRAEVTNYGPASTFSIQATDNQGFITLAKPTVMTLSTGETKKMQVDLWIPADTPKYAEVIVKFVVTDTRHPEVTNTAKSRALVKIQ